MFGWLTEKRERPASRVEPRIGNVVEFSDVPSSDSVRMGQIFGAAPSAAGAIVSPTTAMRVSTVYACVSKIAGAISTMPLPVYERLGEVRQRVEHPVWWLLNESPSLGWTAATFWDWVLGNILLRGDAFVYLKRRGRAIVEFIPLHRHQVIPSRPHAEGGDLVYDVSDEFGKCTGRTMFRCGPEDMLHFPGFGFDGVSSLSVISWAAREAIGIAIRADEFAGQFYGNGSHFQYALKSTGKISAEAGKQLRDSWEEKYSGKGLNTRPLLLAEGIDVKELSISPVDAQLLESRRWQVSEICRAFGVPPHMVGEAAGTSAWGSGIEQLGIGFVRYTLLQHMTRIAQELNTKIWPVRERYFVAFDPSALLSGDMKAQAEYTSKALGGPGAQGWLTINEARRAMNMPPIPGGDEVTKAGAVALAAPTPNEEEATDDAETVGTVPSEREQAA